MKLLFLAASNSIHSYRWIKYFSDVGHEVYWVSLVSSIFEPLPGVIYFELTNEYAHFGIFGVVKRLRNIIGQCSPDIFHIHCVGTHGLIALFSGFDPIVATPWGSDVIFGKKSPFKRPFITRILRRASLITCDALHMREEVMNFGVDADRIHIINFGIDSERFSPRPPCSSIRASYDLGDAPAVISLRNFEPVYDIATLLMAVPKVLDRYPRTRFLLVGSGSMEKELKELARKLGIEHAVRFVGFLANDQLPHTLCSVDIYVSTSLSDAGIAASTAEAMACCLPVVISDSGENRNWITDGENGYLVPASKADVLADRIKTLLGDPELRQRFGKAGRILIQKRNDYLSEMAKMEALYRQALCS